jgi:hypothetical protein
MSEYRSDPPDLQALVAAYGAKIGELGDYPGIPEQVWRDYDAALERWKASIRAGDYWYAPHNAEARYRRRGAR